MTAAVRKLWRREAGTVSTRTMGWGGRTGALAVGGEGVAVESCSWRARIGIQLIGVGMMRSSVAA